MQAVQVEGVAKGQETQFVFKHKTQAFVPVFKEYPLLQVSQTVPALLHLAQLVGQPVVLTRQLDREVHSAQPRGQFWQIFRVSWKNSPTPHSWKVSCLVEKIVSADSVSLSLH